MERTIVPAKHTLPVAPAADRADRLLHSAVALDAEFLRERLLRRLEGVLALERRVFLIPQQNDFLRRHFFDGLMRALRDDDLRHFSQKSLSRQILTRP